MIPKTGETVSRILNVCFFAVTCIRCKNYLPRRYHNLSEFILRKNVNNTKIKFLSTFQVLALSFLK